MMIFDPLPLFSIFFLPARLHNVSPMQLLNVNGVDLSNASKQDAIKALKAAGDSVELVVGRAQPAPEPVTHM